MKRFFVIALALVLAAAMVLSGCSSESADREKQLKTTLDTIYYSLVDTFSDDATQYTMISKYLDSWAVENKIEVKSKQEHAMVLTNPSTEGCKDADTTVLQCSIDSSELKHSLQTLAIGMTALLGPESHGKIRLIVTESNGGQMPGAESVETKYFDGDNVIHLQYRDKTKLYTSGAESFTADTTSPIHRVEPSYTKAFIINMSMPQYIDGFDFESHYPNPVETVGNLLASAKSSGKLFELSSFTSEEDAGYVPNSATAVVVIDENNVEGFRKRFDSSYENMQKRFKKLDGDFIYTMTETTLPDSVISREDSDRIISLMYTTKTGIYQQDEDTNRIVAVSDTASISTANDQFKITTTSRSLDPYVLTEMSNVSQTIAGLCDMDYTDSKPVIPWASDNELAQFFMDALESEPDENFITMKSTECDILSSRSPGLNIISYLTDMEAGEKALMNIVHYQESLVEAK